MYVDTDEEYSAAERQWRAAGEGGAPAARLVLGAVGDLVAFAERAGSSPIDPVR